MPRSHADFLACRVLPGLDALRGLAILGVVWHHTGEPVPAVPLTLRIPLAWHHDSPAAAARA